MSLEQLIAQFNIANDAELDKIGRTIVEIGTADIKPVSSEKPQAFILGGQPGAGKSELIGIVQGTMTGNVVICNADNFRAFHPRHAEIIKEVPSDLYPDVTAPYAMYWNKMLRDHCEAHKLNYVLETTFSSGKRMNDTISEMKSKNYEVSILLLAVHSDVSYLYTVSRYEDMHASAGYGRTVGKQAHDERYDKIMDTLRRVQEAKLYDHISIYGRPGIRAMKDRKNGLIEKSADSKNPFKDYRKEREKEWSVTDRKYFMQEALSVVERMVRREAPYGDIRVLFDNYRFDAY